MNVFKENQLISANWTLDDVFRTAKRSWI